MDTARSGADAGAEKGRRGVCRAPRAGLAGLPSDCEPPETRRPEVWKPKPTKPNVPVVTAVHVTPGGKGFVLPPSMKVIGAGENITVDCDGGTESALAFTIRTYRHFHYIFEIAPLPLAERAKAGTMTAEFFGF